MRKAAFMLALASLAVGCGDGPTEPRIPNIAGTWNYAESFSSSSAGLSCQDQGIITINQNGGNFTGSYNQQGVCTDSQGNAYNNSGSGSIGGGQIEGTRASFSAGSCNYSGTISGKPPNRVSGSVSCTVAAGGTDYHFSGTWTATR